VFLKDKEEQDSIPKVKDNPEDTQKITSWAVITERFPTGPTKKDWKNAIVKLFVTKALGFNYFESSAVQESYILANKMSRHDLSFP
jgi:hypothetical protein